MTTLQGPVRQKLTELKLLLNQWEMERADSVFRELVVSLDREALLLASPELRELVAGFHKGRKRKLTELLDRALLGELDGPHSVPSPSVEEDSPSTMAARYGSLLDGLRDKHIFQWSTHYRETLQYIFRDMLSRLRHRANWEAEVDAVGNEMLEHSREIFERGYRFSVERGFVDDVALAKSTSGLQRFLYLIMALLIDEGSASNKGASRLAWDIASAMICGILVGYGRADFAGRPGWDVLAGVQRQWLPALAFARGADAEKFLAEYPGAFRPHGVFATVLPLLSAIETLANRFQGSGVVLPRHSRVSLGYPPRLDVTLVVSTSDAVQDFTVSAFFEDVVSSPRPIEDAVSLRIAIIVAHLDASLRETDLPHAKILDVSKHVAGELSVGEFSDLVAARLEAHVRAEVASGGGASLVRNYAAEFPLEDPDFRQLFTIERYSVRSLFDGMRRGNGVHLWCSVRRSGKTTAASGLGSSGESLVVFQSMDQQPNQVEQNVLEQRIREALVAGSPIAPGFFKSVVEECALFSSGGAGVEQRKIALVIDEYESLFGLIGAMVGRDESLRFTVAQPLLSQMVGFAARNLLIFMGQRPDAHLVLTSQSQLAPVVKQHNFPLFEHLPGSDVSEFVQFLKRVLSDKLPFSVVFANAVYEETRGHPYLTVNLMVDFCDWLIETAADGEGELSADAFRSFQRDRLTNSSLQRSPHYAFFVGMLGESLSARGRRTEPWLYAVASVLQELGRRKQGLSVTAFHKMAAPYCVDAGLTAQQLLQSAAMANFVRISEAQVVPAIPLLGRLAAVALPRIN